MEGMQQECPQPQSHIEEELHSICQIVFWLTLKSILFIQVILQSHAIGFCKGSKAFFYWYCAELKLTKFKYNLLSNHFFENDNLSVDF
jgi:hypothetical protein